MNNWFYRLWLRLSGEQMMYRTSVPLKAPNTIIPDMGWPVEITRILPTRQVILEPGQYLQSIWEVWGKEVPVHSIKKYHDEVR
jgi:hypothetical protein